MRVLLLAVGFLAAAIVTLSAFALDEGEVVTLISVDGASAHFETTVWVVEIDGIRWLRATRPDALWLARLRRHPEVELGHRGGLREPFRATPVDTQDDRRRVSEAMALKYGTADRILQRFVDLDRAVPVRLDSRPTDGAAPVAPPGP